MAYSNFTLEMVRTAFQLEIVESAGIFSEIASVDPSEHLATTLARNVPLAITINTGKAKSELIIADILVELREQLERRISLFSGIDFSIDAENGLTGVCDFLVSLSPILSFLDPLLSFLLKQKRKT